MQNISDGSISLCFNILCCFRTAFTTFVRRCMRVSRIHFTRDLFYTRSVYWCALIVYLGQIDVWATKATSLSLKLYDGRSRIRIKHMTLFKKFFSLNHATLTDESRALNASVSRIFTWRLLRAFTRDVKLSMYANSTLSRRNVSHSLSVYVSFVVGVRMTIVCVSVSVHICIYFDGPYFFNCYRRERVHPVLSRLNHSSRPNSHEWSLSPGTSNCSWTSCREGCTKELYDCTQILVNYKLPENVSEGTDGEGGAVGGVEDDEGSKRYERSLNEYVEFNYADGDETGLPKPYPTGTKWGHLRRSKKSSTVCF